MRTPKLLLSIALLTVVGAVSSASAATGRVAKLPAIAPEGVGADLRLAGTMCVADQGIFRVWWTEVPGRAQTIQGSDGNCATLPAAAQGSLDALERGRAAIASMGFPTMAGDNLPRIPFQRSAFRTLRSLSPDLRARTLARVARDKRGRIFASFTPAQRRVVGRGLPLALRRAIAADIRRAELGAPSDFAGGDRRVDVTLTANSAYMGQRDGVTSCLTSPALFGANRFRSTSMAVLTTGPAADTATLAHELFHVVQCNRGVVGTADLVMEGTAEWTSATVDPVGFVGGVVVDPADGRRRITGGAARVVGFCTSFTPHAGPGLDNYRSFPVWMQLEKQQPGTIKNLIAAAVKGVLPSSDATMAIVGDARWTTALGAAHQATCGNLTTPTANMTFPVDTRGFIASNTPDTQIVHTGGSVSAAVPVGGITSIGLRWTTPTPTIMLSSPQLTPDQLAPRIVASGRTAPLQVTPTPTGVSVVVPVDQIDFGMGFVSIASPGLALPITVTASIG